VVLPPDPPAQLNSTGVCAELGGWHLGTTTTIGVYVNPNYRGEVPQPGSGSQEDEDFDNDEVQHQVEDEEVEDEDVYSAGDYRADEDEEVEDEDVYSAGDYRATQEDYYDHEVEHQDDQKVQ